MAHRNQAKDSLNTSYLFYAGADESRPSKGRRDCSASDRNLAGRLIVLVIQPRYRKPDGSGSYCSLEAREQPRLEPLASRNHLCDSVRDMAPVDGG